MASHGSPIYYASVVADAVFKHNSKATVTDADGTSSSHDMLLLEFPVTSVFDALYDDYTLATDVPGYRSQELLKGTGLNFNDFKTKAEEDSYNDGQTYRSGLTHYTQKVPFIVFDPTN